MKPELQNKLYQKYPRIFRQKDLDMSKTCMCWGIEVGDGWYDIIDEICAGLDELYYEYGVVIEASQVKEKFGGLRFYTEMAPRFLKLTKEEIKQIQQMEYDIIGKGEKKSYSICESCGAPAKSITKGWYRTLCESCDEEYKKSRTLP